jgi:predicted nucleotidyltransferase
LEIRNTKNKVTRKLGTFFSSLKEGPAVELAYFFGSCADDADGPSSDYDIAVLFAEVPIPSMKYKLAHQLATILLTDRVDLVVLNQTSVELRYAVITTGIVVYEVNLTVRVEFEASTLSRYGDYLPILRRQRKEILEEYSYEAGIQRYRTALGQTQRLLKKIRTV